MSDREILPIDKEFRAVLDEAHDKYIDGEKKHGVLDIDKDPRNWITEAINELLDSIVYTSAEIIRLKKVEAMLNEFTDDEFKIDLNA